MTISARSATCAAFPAISTPVSLASAQRSASMSKPITLQPLTTRLRAIAPPMMPNPMIPTACPVCCIDSPKDFAAAQSALFAARSQIGADMKIGVAGLGKMGSAIAERLIECGHDLVVWNRTPEKTAALTAKGATAAPTAADLARAVEAVVTILFDAEAIDGVYRTRDGVLATDLSGKLVIDMSTVRPQTAIALAKDVRARGGTFVECPVGGSTGPAKQGKLLGMAGGEAADVARARPILDQLCRRFEHFGPVGAGARMKLAINLPLIVSYQALAEAFILSRPNGMDPVQLMEFFADTESLGAKLPLAADTLKIFEEAAKAGWGRKDGANLPAYWPQKVAAR